MSGSGAKTNGTTITGELPLMEAFGTIVTPVLIEFAEVAVGPMGQFSLASPAVASTSPEAVSVSSASASPGPPERSEVPI